MKSVVSEKGQVTIPKALRMRLGIKPGEVLDFVEEGGRLVATKSVAVDLVEAVSGILGNEGQNTDEFIDSVRGPVVAGELDPE